MNYSKLYHKLSKNEYTTIRKDKKGRKVGIIESEKYKLSELHKAKIMRIQKVILPNLELQVLIDDVAPFANTRKEAYILIQSFYHDKINFNKQTFFLFHMKKVRIKEQTRQLTIFSNIEMINGGVL